MPGGKWTPDDKIRIVLESLTTNITVAELCRKYNVNPNVFYVWKQRFIEGGKLALASTKQENVSKGLAAVKENAIISVENALVSHGDVVPGKLTIRADNGSQYTSNAFRKSMSVLGLKLEHIAVNTPEQNGHIESFHKTLKKSSLGYLTPYEFVAKCKAQVINSA